MALVLLWLVGRQWRRHSDTCTTHHSQEHQSISSHWHSFYTSLWHLSNPYLCQNGLTQRATGHDISATPRRSHCWTAAASTSAFQLPKKRWDHTIIRPPYLSAFLDYNYHRIPANNSTTHSCLFGCCFRATRISTETSLWFFTLGKFTHT